MPGGNVACLVRLAMLDGCKEIAVICDDPGNIPSSCSGYKSSSFE